MTKHTPGEWTAVDTGANYWEVDAGRKCVCSIGDTYHPEADARLIAAAPDLLAALQAVAAIKPTNEAGTYDMGMALAEIHRVARAAIRRATGEA